MLNRNTISFFAVAALAFACSKNGAPGADGTSSKSNPGPVKYTTGATAIAGDYDGTKALAMKSGDRTYIHIPRNCPTFSCGDLKYGDLDRTKLKASCPNAYFMSIEVDTAMTKGSKVSMSGITNANIVTGGANGLVIAGATKNELDVVSERVKTHKSERAAA